MSEIGAKTKAKRLGAFRIGAVDGDMTPAFPVATTGIEGVDAVVIQELNDRAHTLVNVTD